MDAIIMTKKREKRSVGSLAPITGNDRTVSNQVYSTIRENIINLSIEPGTQMSEKELADRLDVSRTPVREAFIRLGREGIVNILPQKGTYVSKISIARAKEERFLRESLEKSVLELFIEEKTEDSIKKLRELLVKQQESLACSDFIAFMKYDDMFHKVFYEHTGKTLCCNIVYNYSVDYYRLRFLSLLLSGGIASLNADQHGALCRLVEEGDLSKAQAVLTNHLRKLFHELEPMQEKYPDYFED